MPIYEYQCRGCGRAFSALILSRQERVCCPGCGGDDLRRLPSRFAYHRSEEDRLREYDPNRRQDDGFYRDDRNIGLWAKKKIRQLGEMGRELEPKVNEIVERARSGEYLKDL